MVAASAVRVIISAHIYLLPARGKNTRCRFCSIFPEPGIVVLRKKDHDNSKYHKTDSTRIRRHR